METDRITTAVIKRLSRVFPGLPSKPYVTILEETNEQVLLQCEVEGSSPKAVVVWKDSSGKVVPAKERQETERGGSFHILLQTTVTQSDRYTCEATQEETNQLSQAGIYVPVPVHVPVPGEALELLHGSALA